MKRGKAERKETRKVRTRLVLILSSLVAVILVLAIVLSDVLSYFLARAGVASTGEVIGWNAWSLAVGGVVSVVVGYGLSLLFGWLLLKPIHQLIERLNALSAGDYKAHLDWEKPREMKDVADSFNALSKELSHTEIMRSDFINNFSHEFKTPLVSVKGLLALLKDETLSVEKRREYLVVIEDELERLSTMSTNVLNLTKIENQSILTDEREYNLSEQLRVCLLLLEKKWGKKNLVLSLDFSEYEIRANEDLMKEVWLNLLDNAVKYSNDGGKLEIKIRQTDEETAVEISDEGVGVSAENREKIFNKFYRVDRGDGREGNGIGLPIVKHIVSLHGGTVACFSQDGVTTFKVVLPKGQ